MKIKNIEVNNDDNAMIVKKSDRDIVLYPFIITYRKWFKIKKIKVYPTSNGVFYRGTTNLKFVYYCNEMGEELSNKLSEKLTNYSYVFHNFNINN